LNKLDFSSPKDNLYQVWLISVCWFWRRRFLSVLCTFTLLLLSPLGEGYPLPLKKIWILSLQGLSVTNLVIIGPVVLEKIFKWTRHIFTFLWLSPLWRRPGPLFEQTWFPLPKYNLYQVWLILACWFWRRRFFITFQCIFTLSLLYPLGKGVSPSFEQIWILFTLGWFVPLSS
jgi:hypothetical protein